MKKTKRRGKQNKTFIIAGTNYLTTYNSTKTKQFKNTSEIIDTDKMDFLSTFFTSSVSNRSCLSILMILTKKDSQRNKGIYINKHKSTKTEAARQCVEYGS